MKIGFAPQDKVETLYPYVDQVMKALGHPEALVTDWSSVADFFRGTPDNLTEADERLLENLRETLGITVEAKSLIVDIAAQLFLKEGYLAEKTIVESLPEY